MSHFSNLDIVARRRAYEEYHETAESLREGYDIGQETVHCVGCDHIVPKDDAHKVPGTSPKGPSDWLCDDCFDGAGLVHCSTCGEACDKTVAYHDSQLEARLKGEYWTCPVCHDLENEGGVEGA